MPRKEFTKKTKRLALERSSGKCEAVGVLYGLDSGKRCNGDLGKGVEFDHVLRASDGGDNDLENCLAVCKQCHAHKTRTFDTPQAAKTKRMSDKARGVSKPTGQLKSRGFSRPEKQPRIDKSAIDKAAVNQGGTELQRRMGA